MRKLGLAPPRGSPYGGEPCLDVARNWMGLLQRQLAEQVGRQLMLLLILHSSDTSTRGERKSTQ